LIRPVAASLDAACAADFTTKVANASAGLRYADLSEPAIRRAEHCFFDFFGNSIAGCRDPAVVMILKALAGEAAGAPEAGLIGYGRRVPLRLAALVNGTAGHAIDYDDNNLTMPGHVSVVVIPGLLALAEERGKTGADVVTALVAAFDAGCTIGAALAPGHYERGFHATATIGALASAAGAANLISLDATTTARAVGIAATSAAGLKGMFGTMCKPLHAGRAAEAGLFAAILAELGFTAAENAIERRQGFAETHAPAFSPLPSAPRHGDRHIADNLFKFHAACYGTHAAIEASLKLRDSRRPSPAAISRVDLYVGASNDTVCNISEPRSSAEARFSLRHVVAMALVGHDTTDPACYGEPSLDDPLVMDLRRRTIVHLVPDRPITLADVTLELSNGSRHCATGDAGVPDADLDREAARLSAKFECLVNPCLNASRAAELADHLLGLRQVKCMGSLIALSSWRQE
jgi:2-methylcitrate dehydratase PrpD